jgi:hypothetical protein
VSSYLPQYDAAATKAQKATVIASLCHKLKFEEGARFLKKYNEKDFTQDIYVELNDSQIRKKVGHCLRDMSVARQQVITRRQFIVSKKKAVKGKEEDEGQPSSTDEELRDGTDENNNDDDESSIASDSTVNLTDSLSALLPFVDQEENPGSVNSLEPLPLRQQAIGDDMEPLPAFLPNTDPVPCHPPLLQEPESYQSLQLPPQLQQQPESYHSLQNLQQRPPQILPLQPPFPQQQQRQYFQQHQLHDQPFYGQYNYHFHNHYHHTLLHDQQQLQQQLQQQQMQVQNFTHARDDGSGTRSKKQQKPLILKRDDDDNDHQLKYSSTM